MKRIAVIYHSRHGSTERFAREVAAGAQDTPDTEVSLLKAEVLTGAPEALIDFDGLVWGTPTYLGGVSAPFKSFMDATGGLWKRQALKGKLAAGFTVSALPSGDKQSTLLSLLVFSMQHGMIWTGNSLLPEQHDGVPEAQAANRLGSWTGAMAQTGHGEGDFLPGDLRTARLFGGSFAVTLGRLEG